MLDLTKEIPIGLADIARLAPRDSRGRKVHLSTILRWVLEGSPGPDGQRVRLEACRLGGRWVSSREALQRYAERLTPRLHDEPAPVPRSGKARERANLRADQELSELGL